MDNIIIFNDWFGIVLEKQISIFRDCLFNRLLFYFGQGNFQVFHEEQIFCEVYQIERKCFNLRSCYFQYSLFYFLHNSSVFPIIILQSYQLGKRFQQDEWLPIIAVIFFKLYKVFENSLYKEEIYFNKL